MGSAMCGCQFDPPSMEPVATRRHSSSSHATLSHTNTRASLLSPYPSLRSSANASPRGQWRRVGQPCSPLLRMDRRGNPLGVTPRVPPRGGVPVNDSSQDTMQALSQPPPQDGLALSETYDSYQPWSTSMDSSSWEPHEAVVASFQPLQMPESFMERLHASGDGIGRLVA
jgi:hypothetical protein